ncbi:MAG: beta-lactamase family protein [Planctomycetes bacterium]|nr:beta-lactamase family protein [Planctomycetota bacterium]
MRRPRTSELFLAGIVLVASSLAVGAVPRQDPSATAPSKPKLAPRDLAPLLKPSREKGGVPGLVAAIVRGGELVALGADGVRKHGDPTPITVNDCMHLGSCTKAMTATLAARCVEAGKLRWDSKLSELFPGVDMLPAWRDVTLELLLTNRAGAPENLDAGGLWRRLWKREGTPTEQRRELLLGVVQREPAAPPGTKFLYSNAGFAIAGHALETFAEKPWEELVQAELFTPLGITTAGFGAPGTKGKVDEPLGHVGDHPIDVGPEGDNPPAIGPAGIVHMSIADWAKFVALHLDAECGRPRLLAKESFAKLHAVPANAERRYAMGWGVERREWAGGEVLTHSGSNTMWFCVTWIAPKKDLAVLVCCNAGGDDAAKCVDGAAWALIQDELARTK